MRPLLAKKTEVVSRVPSPLLIFTMHRAEKRRSGGLLAVVCCMGKAWKVLTPQQKREEGGGFARARNAGFRAAGDYPALRRSKTEREMMSCLS